LNKILLAFASVTLSLNAIADDSPFSIAIGQKTLHTDMSGYQINEQSLEGVTASANAIYTNISYNQTPSLSYSFEYASFIGANAAEAVYKNISFNGSTLEEDTEELKVTIEPNTYLSLQSQYTFRIGKTVKPYLFAGLSYISSDIEQEYIATENDITTNNERSVITDTSTGLTYGAGLDIRIYKNISFIFDYRIQQTIADQSSDEMNGSFKYRF